MIPKFTRLTSSIAALGVVLALGACSSNAPMMDPATGGPGGPGAGPGTGPGGGADPEELAAEKARADRAEAAASAAMQEAAREKARADAAEMVSRTFTVSAGETERRGTIDYTCASGGAACVVTIDPDGDLTNSGGELTVATRGAATVPDGVTFPTSANGNIFTIPAGTTAMRGTVDIACGADGPCNVRIAGGSVYSSGTVTVTMSTRTSVTLTGDPPDSIQPYSMTVPAGTTAYHGVFDFVCAAGEDCVVVMDANGEVSSSGGTLTASVSTRTVREVENLPEGFMPKAAYSITVAAGTTARRGPMDFGCAGSSACFVVVAADGEVSATGEITVTAPREVLVNPWASLVTARSSDNDFTISRGSTATRNDYLVFSCPSGTGPSCRVLVDPDGTIFATPGVTITSVATAFYRSRPTPAAASVLAPVVMAPGGTAMTAAPQARSAPRLFAVRGDTSNEYAAGDLINKEDASAFPMRMVTVRETGAVHDGHPRTVDRTKVPGTPADSSAVRGDTLQARGTPRGTVDQTRTYEEYTRQDWVESDAVVAGTIALDDEGGVTVQLGSRLGFPGSGSGVSTDGTGVAFNDMKIASPAARPAAMDGETLRAWAETNHGDVEIAFTRAHKGDDPHSDGAHYWKRDVEFASGGTTGTDGSYELWLSNRVAPGSEDDRFLSYAAYGLFNFIDNTLAMATDVDDNEYRPATARLQGLHFGFDTPDADITALRALGTAIDVSYTGRTTAFMMRSTGASSTLQDCSGTSSSSACNAVSGTNAVYMNPVEGLLRLRGDVRLEAEFGGSTNRIRGRIENFEGFVNGRWMSEWWGAGGLNDPNLELTRVQLGAPENDWGVVNWGGEIQPGTDQYRIPFAGYYRGTAAGFPHNRWGGGFGGSDVDPSASGGEAAGRSTRYTGEFVGDFYGPSTNSAGPAETAGWWRIAGDADPGSAGGGASNVNTSAIGVVGSFGAKRDPEPRDLVDP